MLIILTRHVRHLYAWTPDEDRGREGAPRSLCGTRVHRWGRTRTELVEHDAPEARARPWCQACLHGLDYMAAAVDPS